MLNPETIEPPFQCQLTEIHGKPIYIPYLEIAASGTALVVSQLNSLVRTFDDEYANHLEARIEGSLKGLRLDKDILDKCLEYGYSWRYDMFIDDQTLDWLANVEAIRLDDELDEL